MSNGVAAAAEQHHAHRDPIGAKTGMWLFLFTELLLFGGLFVIYAVYRNMYGEDFHHAAAELNVTLGVTNTMVLLTSSLTMVLSITSLQRGKVGRSLGFLAATMSGAVIFMIIKFFEWSAKYDHHIFPGQAHLRELPYGEDLFFNLYFMMTGLHGIHVMIGLIVMIVVFFKVRGGSIHPGRVETLDFTGLYWHLVDLIWIFLLPLFYLTN